MGKVGQTRFPGCSEGFPDTLAEGVKVGDLEMTLRNGRMRLPSAKTGKTLRGAC